MVFTRENRGIVVLVLVVALRAVVVVVVEVGEVVVVASIITAGSLVTMNTHSTSYPRAPSLPFLLSRVPCPSLFPLNLQENIDRDFPRSKE